MSIITDFFFGKEKIILNSKIGELSARVKESKPFKNYTWTSEASIIDQTQQTVFILEGNSEGPYPNQLDAVYKILDNLEIIINKVDIELKKLTNNTDDEICCKSNYFIDAITPGDEINNNKLEINFSPIIKDNLNYITVIWDTDKIEKIEIM